ncbi:MAG: hypothetical protein NVS2B9_14710 [Myxococcales bacterium]
MPGSSAIRVLCVEDDEQVCIVLCEALHSQGYQVESASDVASALDLLRKGGFDLIVTDYWLPDRTGAALLGDATAEGLLHGTSVLVVTAEHRPQGVENLPVLRKPFDLDDFSKQVDALLASARKQRLERLRIDTQEARKVAQGQKDKKVELVLYESSTPPASFRAVRRLQELLQRFDSDDVHLLITDVLHDRSGTAGDRVVFTPTLVKRSPEPRAWIVGDLEDNTIVEDLLTFSGVRRIA